MAGRFPRAGFSMLLFASLSLHGGMLYGLHERAQAGFVRPLPKASVSIKMAALKPPEPVVESVPVPAARPAQAPVVKTKRAAARKIEPQAQAPKAAARAAEASATESAAVDFTGLTLTNPHGSAGWASVTGNGQAMEGPIALPVHGTGTRSGMGSGTGQAPPGKSPVVGLASLSRPPRAPALDDALRVNYPADARAQGVAGHAVVRARILADGRVGETRVLVASAPEFGRACQRTLSGSRWSPPLDKVGQPVSTEVSYQCQFEVTR